jgi:threonine 3-dehydrogenase
MKDTMKALVKETAGPGLTLTEVPVPEPGPEEVLVEVEAISICGTDYHIYEWNDWSANRIQPPLIAGHEFAGTVVAVGERVSRVNVGDHVSAETHIICEECHACRTGQGHVCHNVEILGVDRDGCFAEYIALPADNAWVNNPELDWALASIQEPLGNAVHTAFKTPIPGSTVCITGAGPIGLMAIDLVRASGAAKVFATEVAPYRIDMAEKMGATVLNPAEQEVVSELLQATEGTGVDIVLEMSGHPQAINEGFAALRMGGYMSLLGIPARPVKIDLADDVVFKGITIYGISGRMMYDTWYKVKNFLDNDLLRTDEVITHELPFEEYEKGMELMADKQCGKVVLHF